MDFLSTGIFVTLLFMTSSSPFFVISEEIEIMCPDEPPPPECICDEGYWALLCGGPEDGSYWNLTRTFDSILFNESVVFTRLILRGEGLLDPQPIEANTIDNNLKFREIFIEGHDKFSTIDLDAFSSTYDFAEKFIISGYTFADTSIAFEFFNKFKKVEHLFVNYGAVLREIPEHAYGDDLTNLNFLSYTEAGTEVIGDFAFRALSGLATLHFQNNSLTDAGISKDAFSGIHPNVTLILLEISLTHLDEEKFKGFLDNTQKTLVVGSTDIKPDYFLNCDERADWICDNHDTYRDKLIGFYCKEEEYLDVFEYCYLQRDTPPPPSPPPPQVIKESTSNHTILIIVSIVFLLVIIILIFVAFKRRQNEKELWLKLEREFRTGKEDEAAAVPSSIEDNEVDGGDWLPILPYTDVYEILPPRQTVTKDVLLGGGNFGTVFSGTLKTLRSSEDSYITVTPVAVKGLRPEQRSVNNLKALCNELRIMMTIKHCLAPHPNVVNFIGALTKELSKCDIGIIMELCGNGSLKKYLSYHRRDLLRSTKNGIQSISPEAYKWSYEIASGMLFLTQNKILHIDLAARNILLTNDNVAKISDFGSSRKVHEKKDYYQGGELSCHMHWTALEVLKGGNFSAQSDVWSYGVTLWEIYSMGSEPNYRPDTDIQLQLEMGIRLSPPPYGDNETKQVVRECWNTTPDTRPTFAILTTFFKQKFEEIRTGSQQSTSASEDPIQAVSGYIPYATAAYGDWDEL